MQRVTADQADGIGCASRTVDGARDSGAGSSVSGRMRRMMWSRALPGTVVLIAALTIPELSVGAGDFVGEQRRDGPGELSLSAGPRALRHTSTATNRPVSRVSDTPALSRAPSFPRAEPGTPTPLPLLPASASQSRIANLDPAAIPVDDTFPMPSGLFDLAAVSAAVSAPLFVGANSQSAENPRITSAAADTLDKAAEYAASALKRFTAPPGLRADTSLAIGVPAPYPATDSLDTAASYTASVIEKFVEQSERRPKLSAAAPGFDGGEQQLTGAASPPSASQPTINAALVFPSTIPHPGVVAQAVPSGLGESVSDPPLPAMAAQLPANVKVSRFAAPEQVRLAPAPPALRPAPTASAALASAAPSAAARSIAAPKPVPLARPVAALAAAVARPAPALTAPTASPYQLDITSQLITRVDGKFAGAVDFAQSEAGIKVRLGSIVELLGDRYEPAQLARIRASAAGNAYLPLAELQAQGIPISYDPVYDEFNVGLIDTRPKAARKTHMDQISAPERGLGSTGIEQVRR